MEYANKLKTISIDKNSAVISVNSKIHPLYIIKSAAFLILDKSYVVIEGDPMDEIEVEIITKGPDIKEIVEKFHEELINQSVYDHNSRKNRKLVESSTDLILYLNSDEMLDPLAEGLLRKDEAENPTDEQVKRKKENQEKDSRVRIERGIR